MTLQQLSYVVEVYRAGSLSRAAQRIYVAQPNLSSSIKALEDEIGITIFKRTPKGMEPTRSGKAFIRRATELMTQFSAFEKMYNGKNPDVLNLSVSLVRSSEFSNCITMFLDGFYERNIPYRIHLREATTAEVIDDVAVGNADVGIISPNSMTHDFYYQSAHSRGLEVIYLKPKTYYLLLSKMHPLAQQTTIAPQMLEPYIEVVHGDYDMPFYPSSDYCYQQTMDADCAKERVIFIYERGTLMEVLSNVRGSYMWSTHTSRRLKEAYGLVDRKCSAPPVEGMDAIVYNRAVSLSEDVRQLIETIKAYDALLRREE